MTQIAVLSLLIILLAFFKFKGSSSTLRTYSIASVFSNEKNGYTYVMALNRQRLRQTKGPRGPPLNSPKNALVKLFNGYRTRRSQICSIIFDIGINDNTLKKPPGTPGGFSFTKK